MNLKRLNLFLALAFSVYTLSWGQAGKINFEEYDLPNGLHVILSPDHSTPIVAVTVMYHVGSKNEDPNRTGFAHFFEHLMFEGSKNIPRGEYSKYVENAGGTLNANTSNDRTYFYEVLPSNQLPLGLWLESERMLHLKVDSIGIETQRGVVKEEKKERIDNAPYGTFLQEMLSHAYTVSPYRWPPIGSVKDLNAASYDEFMMFYKKYYVPGNAVLTIVGDINIDSTKALVSNYFGGIPAGKYKIVRPDASEPESHAEVVDTVYDNIQLPAIFEGYHIPPMSTDDFYAMDMLNQLLSYGQSSRLYKSLVDDQQLALQVAAVPLPFEGPGLSIVYAIPNVGVEPEDVKRAIEAELDKVKESLISEREFEKLRNQVENSFVTGNATIASRASNLATDYTFFNDTNLINTEIEKYMAVTREDLKRVANIYYRTGNRVILYYLPKSEEKN